MGIFTKKGNERSNNEKDFPIIVENSTSTKDDVVGKGDELESAVEVSGEELENTPDAPLNSTDENIKEEQSLEKSSIEPDVLNQILELLNGVNGNVLSLQDLFSVKISNSESDEKTISLLHTELQQYKNDLYSQLVKPILMDIIDIREGILHTLNFLDGDMEESNQSKHKDALKEYAEQIEYILEKYGVCSYKSEIGNVFNPLKQRVVKKIETDNQSLHGKVAESLSFGYEYKEKAISIEKVNVYFYVKTNQEG